MASSAVHKALFHVKAAHQSKICLHWPIASAHPLTSRFTQKGATVPSTDLPCTLWPAGEAATDCVSTGWLLPGTYESSCSPSACTRAPMATQAERPSAPAARQL